MGWQIQRIRIARRKLLLCYSIQSGRNRGFEWSSNDFKSSELKIKFTGFVLLSLTLNVLGQQLPQYSQYLLNYSVLNSSYSVYEPNQLILGARSQMMGFGLEPNTAFVLGFIKLKPKKANHYNPYIRISQEIKQDTSQYNRVVQAIGGGFVADRYGAFNVFTVQASYALGYDLNSDWKISSSIKASFNSASINKERVAVLNIENPYQDYNGGDQLYDQLIGNGAAHGTLQMGLSGTIKSKEFLFGISVDQLTGNTFDLTQGPNLYEFKSQISAMAAYTYSLDEQIKIHTGILIKKMNPTPLSFELSSLISLTSQYSIGFNYRHQSSFGILAGISINEKFKLAYSYDYITTRLNMFSWGGHEITLGYEF